MSLTFATASMLNEFSGVKALVYAESGAGKTVLCATAPRPLLISAESGTLSLNRGSLERIFGVNNPEITYDPTCMVVESLEDLNEAYRWATEAPEASQFETICLDSATEIAEKVLAHAKTLTKDPRQAYGELIDKMIMLMKAFRDIRGKNVVNLCKQEMVKDEFTGITRFGPSMPGTKVGPALPYLFDEVFYLGQAKTTDGLEYRYLQTGKDMQKVAKDRSGALAFIEEPNLTRVFNKIKGAVNHGHA